MIIPARWFGGGRGLDTFRSAMLHDNQLCVIHDFVNAADCFPGVEIKGGVCYFLWQQGHEGRAWSTPTRAAGSPAPCAPFWSPVWRPLSETISS